MDSNTGQQSFVEYFKETYYEKLKTPSGNNPVRNRADSLLKIFEILEKKPQSNFYVLETGCMRPDHGDFNFSGDGCATFIFDDFINKKDGTVLSVDIEPVNTAYAKSKVSNKTLLHTGDSVAYLYGFASSLKFDLIYLDSYDIIQADPHPSQLHHIKELAAVLKNTKPGTLICVDDHDAFFTGGTIGKGNYVKSFMQDIGAKLIHEDYQIVWEMP
jgi:hypothetical protein